MVQLTAYQPAMLWILSLVGVSQFACLVRRICLTFMGLLLHLHLLTALSALVRPLTIPGNFPLFTLCLNGFYPLHWLIHRLVVTRFDYDSDYAANLVQRIYRPSCNFSLVIATRDAFDALRPFYQVSWNHVFSHTGDLLNERADLLAKVGARRGLVVSHHRHRCLLLEGLLH